MLKHLNKNFLNFNLNKTTNVLTKNNKLYKFT